MRWASLMIVARQADQVQTWNKTSQPCWRQAPSSKALAPVAVGSPRHRANAGRTCSDPCPHQALSPAKSSNAMVGTPGPSSATQRGQPAAGGHRPCAGITGSGPSASSAPSSASSEAPASSADSAMSSSWVNQSTARPRQSASGGASRDGAANTNGKQRPTRSMLGIITPLQACGPHSPGASTKRHSGLLNQVSCQLTPSASLLATMARCSQASKGSRIDDGRRLPTKSP